MHLYSLIYILTIFVYSSYAVSSFIEQGKRPELFELLDDEVAVFRINLPGQELADMKNKASIGGIEPATMNVTQVFENYKQEITQLLNIIKRVNFKMVYPNYDFSKEFPGLNIGYDGYPKPDIEKLIKGYDLNPKNYIDFDFINDSFSQHAMKSNPNFDLIKFKKVLTELNLPSNVNIDPYFKQIVEKYKYYAYLNQYYANASDEDDPYDFKSKDASMTVELNGKKVTFDKITFSLGGQSSRYFTKPGYNIKIKDGKDLFGRRQLKLRSDVVEASYMRTKLVSDIHQRLGLPGIAANYATLYINNEYMGLFIITDSYKKSWVEFEYGEKNTTSLYKCDYLYSFLSSQSSSYSCINANDKATDNSEFQNFLKTLDAAQSAADIEDIFDVDQFLTEMALEYLLGAWDHYIFYGHNYFMYKPKGGKWTYLSHDFDLDLGQSIDKVIMDVIIVDLPERMEKLNLDYPNYSYGDWIKHQHLTDILIFKNPERFETILKNVVKKAFNPTVLYPHIDELKEFIRPYVKKDKTPNSKGVLPGVINTAANDYYSYEQWEANTEFTSVKEVQYFGYGIKYWILAKYRNVCQTFKDLECDETFLDENYYYPIDEKVEFPGYFGRPTTPRPGSSKPVSGHSSTTTPTKTATQSKPSKTSKPQNQCWSELIGYPCCPSGVTTIYAQNEYGDWGYDFEKNTWCGLTAYEEPKSSQEPCWSETLGYSCCKGCQVITTDSSGSWGIENNQWCGTPSYCKN